MKENNNIFRNKLSKDFSLNLLASLISTGVAQLLLYPSMASIMSAERYGELLTLRGIANTMGARVVEA